jgi:hypothetical protein
VLEGELVIDSMEFTPGLFKSESEEFQQLATSLEEEVSSCDFCFRLFVMSQIET